MLVYNINTFTPRNIYELLKRHIVIYQIVTLRHRHFNVSIRTIRPLFTLICSSVLVESTHPRTRVISFSTSLSPSSFSLLPRILSRFSATYRQFSARFSDTCSHRKARDCYRFCVENFAKGAKMRVLAASES